METALLVLFKNLRKTKIPLVEPILQEKAEEFGRLFGYALEVG